MAILSCVLWSTSGRLPALSCTSRFWISVLSLNRPPTLLTIDSSFRASSMGTPNLTLSVVRYQLFACGVLQQYVANVADGLGHVVVDDFVAVAAFLGEFPAGGGQPAGKRILVLRIAGTETALQLID